MPYEIIPPESGRYEILPPEERSTSEQLTRGTGLAARGVATGLAGIPNMFGDAANAAINLGIMGVNNLYQGANIPLLGKPSQSTQNALTSAGLPQAETTAESLAYEGAVPALTGTGGVMKGAEQLAAKYGPGVVKDVMNLLQANRGAQAVGATSAGTASNAVAQAGGNEWEQLLAAFAAGIGAPLVGKMATNAAAVPGRLVSNTVKPFFESGRQNVAGNTLNEFAQSPTAARFNLSDVPENVPGSVPTTAQASRDVGLAGLERTLANKSTEFARRQQQNNAARVQALDDIAKSPEDLAAARSARDAEASSGYGAANRAPLNADTPIDPLLDLLKRPAFKAAVKRAEDIALNEGNDLKGSLLNNTQGLHYVKMALDDTIGTAGQQGIGAAQRRAIVGTQQDFLRWLDKASPEYASARQKYAAASGPVNQMETLQDIYKRTQTAAPDASGTPVLSQAKWKNVVTNKIDELGKTLSPDQIKTLRAIGDDLDMATVSNAGKAAGSNTAQNLTMANLLGQTFGRTIGNNAIMRTIARPLQWVQQIPEAQLQDLLEQAMLDPTTARLLMSKATPKNAEGLALMLKKFARAGAQGGAIASSVDER